LIEAKARRREEGANPMRLQSNIFDNGLKPAIR
jgi:hypothetical protein